MANITDTSLIGRQVKLLGESWKAIQGGDLFGKIVTLEAGNGYYSVGFRPSFQPSAVYFVDENPGDAWYGELIPEAVETPVNPLEGVWRSKVDPNFFVFPVQGGHDADGWTVRVLSIIDGRSSVFSKHISETVGETYTTWSNHARVAAEYFADHAPGPGAAAKPGDSWLITVDNETFAALVREDEKLHGTHFVRPSGQAAPRVDSKRITSATILHRGSN